MGKIYKGTLSKPSFLDHRVSWKTKQTKKWYKPIIDNVISNAGQDMEAINRLYAAANGTLTNEDAFKYMLKPFGNSANETLKSFKFPGEIREDSLITPIIEKLVGEFIRQLTDVVVISAGDDTDNQFKAELTELLTKNLSNAVGNELSNSEMPIQMEESKVDTQKEVDAFIENWTSEGVIVNQEALDYIRYYTDSDAIYIKCFYDWIVTGRAITYRTIIHDDLIKSHVPANEYYPIDNGEEFVSDHNAGRWQRYMSIEDIVARYRDDISDDEMAYLLSFYENKASSGTLTASYATVVNRTDGYYYKGGFIENFKSGQTVTMHSKNNMIPIELVHFTSERKVGTVYYMDAFGNTNSKLVDETYKLNKDGGDIRIEWTYVPDRLEAVRIGSEDIGVYIPPYRVEAQRFELNNIQSTKSGFNGKLSLFKNAYDHSIVKRGLPYDTLYKIYTLQLERIISKEVNNGRITIIPQSLLTSDSISEEQNIYYMTADGRVFVDDTDPGFINKVNGFKVIDSGLGKIIKDIRDVRANVKLDFYDAIGWNRQRDGDIYASDGKGNTDQAIYRSALSSILIFWMFDKFMEKDYEADLDFAKFAWDEDDNGYIKKGGYIVSDRRAEYLKLSAKVFRNSSSNIFVQDRAKVEDQIKGLKEIGFAAAQNGQQGIAAEIVTTTNPDKIKEYISKSEKLQAEYAANAQEAEQASKQEAMAFDRDKEQARIASDEKIANIKAAVDREKIASAERIAGIRSADVDKSNASKERTGTQNNETSKQIESMKQAKQANK